MNGFVFCILQTRLHMYINAAAEHIIIIIITAWRLRPKQNVPVSVGKCLRKQELYLYHQKVYLRLFLNLQWPLFNFTGEMGMYKY